MCNFVDFSIPKVVGCFSNQDPSSSQVNFDHTAKVTGVWMNHDTGQNLLDSRSQFSDTRKLLENFEAANSTNRRIIKLKQQPHSIYPRCLDKISQIKEIQDFVKLNANQDNLVYKAPSDEILLTLDVESLQKNCRRLEAKNRSVYGNNEKIKTCIQIYQLLIDDAKEIQGVDGIFSNQVESSPHVDFDHEANLRVVWMNHETGPSFHDAVIELSNIRDHLEKLEAADFTKRREKKLKKQPDSIHQISEVKDIQEVIKLNATKDNIVYNRPSDQELFIKNVKRLEKKQRRLEAKNRFVYHSNPKIKRYIEIYQLLIDDVKEIQGID